MANPVFGRYYEVTFREISTIKVDSAVKYDYINLYTIKSVEDTKDKTSLQMYGSIKRSLKSSGDSPDNVLTLSFVNLPKDIVTRLDSADVLRVSVTLGYTNLAVDPSGESAIISEVFTGDVKDFSSTHDGLNFVTSMAAVAGVTPKTGSTVNKIVTAGTPVKEVFEQIVKTFSETFLASTDTDKAIWTGGVAVAFEGTALDGITFQNDRSFEGMTSKVLEELCNEFKVYWGYEGDTVHIYTLNNRESSLYNLLNLEKSNVIGGLGVKFESAGRNKRNATKASQVTMTTFLDPRISIRTLIVIPESFDNSGVTYSGRYVPEAWSHEFNYRSDTTWTTNVFMNRSTLTEDLDAQLNNRISERSLLV